MVFRVLVRGTGNRSKNCQKLFENCRFFSNIDDFSTNPSPPTWNPEKQSSGQYFGQTWGCRGLFEYCQGSERSQSLLNLFLTNEDFWVSSLFSAIAVILYPPTNFLKILRWLGKSRKRQQSSVISKDKVNKETYKRVSRSSEVFSTDPPCPLNSCLLVFRNWKLALPTTTTW